MDPESLMNCEPVAVYSFYCGDPPTPAEESSESTESPNTSTSDESSSQEPDHRTIEPVSNLQDAASMWGPSKWYGCSGFLWMHRGKSWGITYGSILIPLIQNAPEDLKMKFIKTQTEGQRRTYDRQILDTMELSILKENSQNFSARIAAVWSCPMLAAAIDQLSDMGWRFNGIDRDLRMMLSMLVVFLPSSDMAWSKPGYITDALVTLLLTIPRVIIRGNPVMVVSSPFAGNMVPLPSKIDMRLTRASNQGCNDPEINGNGPRRSSPALQSTNGGDSQISFYMPFLNSWSQGLVSGIFGKNKIIIITDARTAMGSEGGPLYVSSMNGYKGKWWHAGMLLRSLCYWRDEYVGYSLAVNLRPALLGFLGKKLRVRPSGKPSPNPTGETVSAKDSILRWQIVLIKCGGHYSSGIPINEDLGLILTCAHSVHQFNRGIYVFWIQNSSGYKVKQAKAKLIYKTPPGKAYDIALISVGPGSGLAGIPIAADPPRTGENVLSLGYALNFGKSMDLNDVIDQPLISGGVVAAVTPGNPPPKLQTTCCVQAGCSGGAILRKEDNTLLGVIVCNTAKHPELSTFPHINFSVPTITLKPFLEDYYRTEDPSVLNGLCTPDKKVQRIWYFGEQESFPSVKRSKL